MEIKISVIMPVYNEESFLGAAIDSFLGQSIASTCELICIDDGSTDSSMGILEEYSKENDNIVILSQENKGSGSARNAGLEVARGEFVAFLDADDLYPNEQTLALLYQLTVENDVDAAGGSLALMRDGKVDAGVSTMSTILGRRSTSNALWTTKTTNLSMATTALSSVNRL